MDASSVRGPVTAPLPGPSRVALLTWWWPGEWGLSFHSLTGATFKFFFFFFPLFVQGFPMEHFVLWYVPIFSVSLAVTCCGFVGLCPFLHSYHDPIGRSLEKVKKKKGILPCQMLLYISGVLELGRLCRTKCGGQDLKMPRFTPALACS